MAKPLPPDEVQGRIEAAARKAVEKLLAGRYRPYYLQPPLVFELSFQNAAQAVRARSDKSVELSGERTICFAAPGQLRSRPRISRRTSGWRCASGTRLRPA